LVESSVAIGNPERHVRKASHRGSKQQLRSPTRSLSSSPLANTINRDHSIIACSRHIHIFLLFAHIPFVVNHTINATPPERLQQ